MCTSYTLCNFSNSCIFNYRSCRISITNRSSGMYITSFCNPGYQPTHIALSSWEAFVGTIAAWTFANSCSVSRSDSIFVCDRWEFKNNITILYLGFHITFPPMKCLRPYNVSFLLTKSSAGHTHCHLFYCWILNSVNCFVSITDRCCRSYTAAFRIP